MKAVNYLAFDTKDVNIEMPKKRLLFALMIYGYIANSLLLGNFSFTDLAKISMEWSIVFCMWWMADYLYNKNNSSAEGS